ncbi:ankyrin repeat-containing domain protein [Poronia punctata]|nr:ankyrin repeat-containing domain protein [Poronia punctata]
MSIREAVDNALLLAVKGGHWWYAALAVPYLIENSANVNCRNEKGQTPLHVALESVGSGFSGYDIIRALLDAGADANAVDGEGRSCLSYAGSDASLVRILAGQGERIGPDALLSAIDAGNDDTLQFLLLAGASPNIPYTFSWSSADAQLAVATAATQGVLVQRQEHDQTEILHEIVRRSGLFWPVWNAQSGDPNRRDAHGRTLFLAACMSSKGPDTAMEDLGAPSDVGKLSILKYLLSVGADPRAKDLRHRNALHCMIQDPSAYYRNNEEVRLFKDSLLFMATTFPDLVNQQDDLGRTPLYTAIEYAINRSVNFHVEPACILLEKAGADPSIPDKDGNFCLHVLAQSIVTSQMADLLRGVVRHGCDINVRNQRSETPMFWLFQESENNGGLPLHGYGGLPLHGYDYIRAADCVALFESLGADMHARDARGRNLLHLAAEVSGARYLFKALLDKGVDPLVEDDEQRTPIDVAAAYKNVQVLALLDRKEGDELVEESDEESDEEWDEEWDL